MAMMPSIYIAGPITKHGYLRCLLTARYASRVEGLLMKAGWHVYNPYASVLAWHNWRIAGWYKHDLYWLASCDAICLLPGWYYSIGACNEYQLARSLGKEAYLWKRKLIKI